MVDAAELAVGVLAGDEQHVCRQATEIATRFAEAVVGPAALLSNR